MKDPPNAGIQASVEQCLDAEVRARTEAGPQLRGCDAEHACFVWAPLLRFGVAEADRG